MNIQEAYIKGLDVAEKEAIEKLTSALDGNDTPPFNNPAMEEIRQRILTIQSTPITTSRNYDFVLDFLRGDEVDIESMTEIDKSILEIVEFNKGLVGAKARSRIAKKAKEFLRNLKVDIISYDDKL
jgi:hypothetical protein